MLRSEEYIVKPGFEAILTRRGSRTPGQNLPPDMSQREIADLLKRNLIIPDPKLIQNQGLFKKTSEKEQEKEIKIMEQAKALETPSVENVFEIIDESKIVKPVEISEMIVEPPTIKEILAVDEALLPEPPVKTEKVEIGDTTYAVEQPTEIVRNPKSKRPTRGKKAAKGSEATETVKAAKASKKD